ncbi:LPS translocon maturation chaperone LptM [Azohydromonas lata]|uniref:LPS translocon maturation chaperone LptM n=1 Tax=Azohydromonas lata TaxID=45677 RepID=UPI003898F56D
MRWYSASESWSAAGVSLMAVGKIWEMKTKARSSVAARCAGSGVKLLLAVGALAAVAACGQKGPLRLPPPPQAQAAPAAAAAASAPASAPQVTR